MTFLMVALDDVLYKLLCASCIHPCLVGGLSVTPQPISDVTAHACFDNYLGTGFETITNLIFVLRMIENN